jgi:hypothetical protein
MSGRFEEVLAERGLLWAKISGQGDQRLSAAVHEVDKLLR